jgi:hypothetical protein
VARVVGCRGGWALVATRPALATGPKGTAAGDARHMRSAEGMARSSPGARESRCLPAFDEAPSESPRSGALRTRRRERLSEWSSSDLSASSSVAMVTDALCLAHSHRASGESVVPLVPRRRADPPRVAHSRSTRGRRREPRSDCLSFRRPREYREWATGVTSAQRCGTSGTTDSQLQRQASVRQAAAATTAAFELANRSVGDHAWRRSRLRVRRAPPRGLSEGASSGVCRQRLSRAPGEERAILPRRPSVASVPRGGALRTRSERRPTTSDRTQTTSATNTSMRHDRAAACSMSR